jgi:OPA family sugar phosphate sensor protein UhpC-like MFS transporter
MSFALRFLQSAPFPPELTDVEEVKKKYKYWRIRVMYSMFLGYVFYYFTRKSFVFSMPGIMEELHLDKGDLGFIGTVFSLTYGISKFFSGVISDQSNPRYFMAFGLIATGACNILFGFSSSLWLFALFWGLNAWFQGFGWPPCVKLLSNWYSHSERGSWWSIWSISHNVGGFISPWIVTICLMYFGWRYALYLPGILSILGGFFLLNRLSDVPRSLGLPAIEKFRNDYPDIKKPEIEDQKLSSKELMLSVLSNRYIWCLALAYFFIYFIRTGIGDWTMLFMLEDKGYNALTATGIVSLFDIGGFIGGFMAGWISDRLFRAKRGPVNALYAFLLVIVMGAYWYIPGGYVWLDSSMVFMIGFATFGPQMLIGLAVAELAPKQATATATGLASWVAYLGSALAGYPLGIILKHFGWNGFFVGLGAAAGMAVLLLVPLWNASRSKLLARKGVLA